MSDSSPPARRSTASTSASIPISNTKLPKFLQRQHHHVRDRSASINEGQNMSSAELSDSPIPRVQRSLTHKTSRLFGGKRNREERRSEGSMNSDRASLTVDNTSSNELCLTTSAASSTRNGSPPPRLTEISGRLSGWFQNPFSSTSDLHSTLASNMVQSSSSSASTHLLSQSIPPSAYNSSSKSTRLGAGSPGRSIMSHIPGKAGVERVVRYFLDSDVAQPDKCTDPIWILGVEHQGYDPSLVLREVPSTRIRRDSMDSASIISRQSNRREHSGSSSFDRTQVSPSPGKQPPQLREIGWPQTFYDDFTSRIWLTYRSHYSAIRDHPLSSLGPPVPLSLETMPVMSDFFWERSAEMPGTSPPKRWGWGGEKTWTSDSGWGCMLRTGQSLLANTLIHLHLSRDWRRPSRPSNTAEYATYVKILTWFLDTPSPLAPFSVHRMALSGKELGKDVGSWFGPSTAAGAIKTLVHAFPACGLSVSAAVDGVLYESEVYAASNVSPPIPHQPSISQSLTSGASSKRHKGRRKWGGTAVLVLVGIRLGIDGVNPVYHESIKKLFTFPQSVGIAGGRPSSSYYFVGYQAEQLFYLDPHHTRPCVSLQPVSDLNPSSQSTRSSSYRTSTSLEPIETVTGRPVPNRRGTPRRKRNEDVDALTNLPDSSSSSPAPSEASLDPVINYYANSYPFSDIRTYHCDRVRKMAITSLDPSMLLGFLCRNESEWKDLRSRMNELGKTRAIFSIQDEPPVWGDDSDDDVGLESVSGTESDMTSLNEGTTNSDAVDIPPDESVIQEFEELNVVVSDARDQDETFDSLDTNDDGEESWINSSPPKPSQPTSMALEPAPSASPELSTASPIPPPIGQHAFPTLQSDLSVAVPPPPHSRRGATHRSRSIRTSKETVIGIGTH